MAANSSSSSELVEMQGTFKLSYPLLADLGCLLTILEEHGCRGNVMFQFLPADLVTQWRRCLTPGRPLRVKIESHPTLKQIELNVVVGEVLDHSNHCEIELRFSQLTASQRVILQKVVNGNVQAAEPVAPPAMAAPNAAAPASAPPAPAAVPSRVPQNPPSFSVFRQLQGVQPAPPANAHAPTPPEPERVPASESVKDGASAPVAVPRLRRITTFPGASAPAAPGAPVAGSSRPLTTGGPMAARFDTPERNVNPANAAAALNQAKAAPGWPMQRQAGTGFIPARPGGTGLLPPRPGMTNMFLPQATHKKRIGSVLVQMGYLTNDQIEEAVKQSHTKGQRLGRYLVGSNMITPDILCRALALQSGLPVTDLSDVEIGDDVGKLFPYSIMMRHSFIPFDDCAMFVCIAVSTPLSAATFKELERTCSKKIEVFLAREDLILKQLNELRKREAGGQPRRFIRYPYAAPVKYMFYSRFAGPSEDTLHDGVTHNISEGGMLIEGPGSTQGAPAELLRRGVCLRVVVNDPPNDMKALCRFKNIQEKTGRWFMGMELLEISADDRRRMKELCVRAMVEQMKKTDG